MNKVIIAGYNLNGKSKISKEVLGREVFQVLSGRFCCIGIVESITKSRGGFRVQSPKKTLFFSINSISDGSKVYSEHR
ncbi:hypothetical protein KO317_01400 [Candidatus Micrarchaeota archaeon]|jgi:hypothetical protein|nr:hypothetical protein [Candidatus Micrarchaeota archaeon]